MIVYSGTKSQFHSDIMTNDIGGIIFSAFKGATGHGTKRSEIYAWTNSLRDIHYVPQGNFRRCPE